LCHSRRPAVRDINRCHESQSLSERNNDGVAHPLEERMSTIAIIPARGGSKGIPRKNLATVAGLPLIVHSIRHAIEAACIDRIIVSTDDPEIAGEARAAGAEVPFMRPSELAGDEVLDLPVFDHSVKWLEENEGEIPDAIVHLRPTTPYRRVEWLQDAVELLRRNSQATSVRSVSPPKQHPYRMFRIGPSDFLEPIMIAEHPSPHVLRRQDLPSLLYYNCVVDVTRASTLKEHRSMTGPRILPYIMNSDDVIDIDTKGDLAVAEILMGQRT
jgi:CMP-N,N'-diacetyllegionaminic acid synthase